LHRILIALFSLLAATAAGAAADAPKGTIARIKATHSIILGHREQARPFSFAGDDGKPAGYSVDLCLKVVEGLRQALHMRRIRVKWVPLQADNRVQAVAAGKVDLECGVTTVTLSRLERVDFSSYIYVDGGTALARKASGMHRLADLDGRTVAVQPGTTTLAALREALPRRRINVQVVEVPGLAQGMQLLEQGKVDALAADRTVLINTGNASREPGEWALLDEDFSLEPIALMMKRGDADFRLAVNRELAKLYRSGDVDEIFYRWFGQLGNPGVLLRAMFYLNGLQD
jgi:ABC-type amino acid transport substrate-binding protein